MESSSMLKNSAIGQQICLLWELCLVPAHSSNHGQFSLKKLCAKGMQCEEIVALYCVPGEQLSLGVQCVCPDFFQAVPHQFSCVDWQIPGIA